MAEGSDIIGVLASMLVGGVLVAAIALWVTNFVALVAYVLQCADQPMKKWPIFVMASGVVFPPIGMINGMLVVGYLSSGWWRQWE